MPWVQAMPTYEILEAAFERGVDSGRMYDAGDNLSGALRWAATVAGPGPVVVAGSLYLVSDLLRLLRKANDIEAQLSK